MADAAKPQDKPVADPTVQESLVKLQAENTALREANEATKAELAKLAEAVTKLTEAKDEALVLLPEAKRGEGVPAKAGAYEAEAAKIKNRFGTAKA
jgi:hypothetical protein